VCIAIPVIASATTPPSIAFYYANNIPIDELSQFDQVVVDPGEITDQEILKLKQFGASVIAYVSVGESERWRKDYKLINKSFFVGVNKGWNSDIMDMSLSGWQDFLMEYRFSLLAKRKFDGFFLDTLDSYQAVYDEKDWISQELGIVKIIKKLAKNYPETKILLNRGFPLLKNVYRLIHGVTAESLYAGWDPIKKEYKAVELSEQKWLLKKLNIVKKKYNIPVTVIDYLPPSKRVEARSIANKIASHGFSPWVANPELNYLGIGQIEVIPRKVLMLYNSNNQYLGDMYSASVHSAAAMPLEYLGFVPVYYDIAEDLPDEVLQGRYVGIVAWFDGQALNDNYRDWLEKKLDNGVKIAFMGGFGFDIDADLLQKLGVKAIAEKIVQLKKVQFTDDYIGFESKPLLLTDFGEAYQSISLENKVHLKISFGENESQYFDPVITADWGGMALHPWITDSQVKGTKYWILNPFKFFKTALNLPDIPMPDVTTENGRRLWMAHIDGDGFLNRAEMPGTPYSAQVIKDKILKYYTDYPHTVSVIEGEIGMHGLYPKQSEKLEKIAREIFKLENVEAASHTYSHPFKWLDIEENQLAGGVYNLAIKKYRFSFKREIFGSIQYINNKLLPKNKKAKIILWTGSALPSEEPLRICADNGYINMNGGGTTIRKDRASLLFVSPMARVVGKYVQVYAPVMNENVYTNNWTGPFYGFQRVVETFEMTDKPRRLKAIDIYYHFYSGSKPAAMKALHKAYQWTIKKDIFPVYVGEYSPKILEFRKIVVAKGLDQKLHYSGTNYLRTLRSFTKDKWPSLQESTNVAGYRTLHDARYYSIGPENKTIIKMVDKKQPGVFLVQSNGRINSLQRQKSDILLSLSSHLPLIIEVASTSKKCELVKVKNKTIKTQSGWKFILPVKEIRNVRVRCK